MNKVNKTFIYFISLVSALGGLLFGYDWVVIGGAKPFYEVFFGISDNPSMQGLAMGMALLGCLIGALMSGMLADRYGRKPLLLFSAFVFLLSAYATGAFSVFEGFLAARFLGGIGIGIASGLSPMYIAEISPAAIRGRMVSLNQLTIVLGILSAQIINWVIAEPIPSTYGISEIAASWNGQVGWRWMFWAEGVPAIFFFVLLLFIPESPRWLALKGRVNEAKKILTKIGGEDYGTQELQEMDLKANANDQGGLKQLFGKSYRKILILGLIVAVFQQWCGTNVIFNYAQEIFQSAGYSLGDVLFNIVITGVANVVFTFIAIYTVERLGRRTLMLFGSLGLSVIYFLLGSSYYFHLTGFYMVVLVVLAIGCYAMSLGPITWVLLSEIFPNKVRAVAMAVCTFALWTACFILTYTFPILNSELGSSGTFWIYSIICLSGFIFFYKALPETKGKTLEALEKELVDHSESHSASII